MKSIHFSSSVIAAAVISVAMSAGSASALTFVGGTTYKSGFANIPGGDTVGDAVFGRYEFTIQQSGANVLFNILNKVTGTNPSRISEVYFDDSGLLTYTGTGTTGGVNQIGSTTSLGVLFSKSTSNFPQGNNIGFQEDFAFDSTAGNSNNQNDNGINAGESLGILFGLQSGKSYQDVLNALEVHSLRVGIHVRDVVPGKSDAYATIPTPALLPGLIGLGLGVIRKRRSEQAQESEA